MKINYITGRAGSGKSYYTYEKIKEKIISGSEKNILIVPEQFTLQAEVDLITKMNLDGLVNVQVLSFKRLAFRIMSEVGGIKKNLITDLGKIMTLRKIFEDHKNDLKIFSKVYHQEGFLQEFSGLISEMKKNGISDLDLVDYAEKVENSYILKNKILDISLIYNKFAESIAGRYIDEEETFNILKDNIPYSEILDGSLIWLDGFNSFSKQEYKILDELFKKASEISLTLTYDHNSNGRDYDLFNPTLITLNKIKEIANINNLEEKEIVLTGNYYKSPELEHLEKNIYSYPAEAYIGNVKDINMMSALNIYNEVENVAINIIKLARDNNYKWKDISVVTNALDNYSSVIKRIFHEYDIPVFIDEKKNISGNPLVVFVKSALRIILYNYKWEDVFVFLKTGFTDLNRDESQDLQNYILEYGIKGRDWRKGFTYIKRKEEVEQGEKLAKLNIYREQITLNIEKMKASLKDSESGKDFAKTIFEFLKNFNVLDKLEDILNEEKEKDNFEFVNENSQIWNIIIEVLEQISEIIGEEKYLLKDFYKVLESGFNSYELGVIPPTNDQVLVGNLERSKSHDIKALFLVGCNDGIIPRSYSEGGILLNNEKITLQDNGMGVYKDNETEMKEEKFLAYSAFSKPSEKLFLSWSLGDLEGKALRPSLLIDRIRRIFPIEIDMDLYFSEDPFEKSTMLPVPTFKFLVENLRKNIDYGLMDDRWWQVYGWYFFNPAWDEKLSLIINGLFHENQVKNNTGKSREDLYLSKDRFSISRIETFTNCPFKHFVKYGLRPKERKEYKIALPDIGTVFHEALEKFPEELKKENIDWNEVSTEKAEIMMEKIINNISEEFQNGLLESSFRNKYLKEKLNRVSKRAIKTLTDQLQKGDYKPWRFEFPFKETILGENEIILDGRIDRVDIWQDEAGSYYLRVIDYKSGAKKFDLNDIYNLTQLQLIIYLTAAIFEGEKILNDKIKPGGAFYFKIDDPFIEGEDKDQESLQDIINNRLKMDGFLLSNEKNVIAMDNTIEESKKSSIIPVTINADGNYSKNSMVFSDDEVQIVFNYVKKMTLKMINEINKGYIKIKPAKGKAYLSCSYCEYSSLCQFDTSFPDNYYRNLEKIKKEDIVKVMLEKSEKDD